MGQVTGLCFVSAAESTQHPAVRNLHASYLEYLNKICEQIFFSMHYQIFKKREKWGHFSEFYIILFGTLTFENLPLFTAENYKLIP